MAIIFKCGCFMIDRLRSEKEHDYKPIVFFTLTQINAGSAVRRHAADAVMATAIELRAASLPGRPFFVAR